MSNGQINGGEIVNAQLDGRPVIEIAIKDETGQIARWRPEEFIYVDDFQPVFRDTVKTRPNGEITQSPDYIAHNISQNKMTVQDGVIKGPPSGYAMAIINKRVTGYRTYIKARVRSNPAITGGGRIRLQLGGGQKPAVQLPHYQWITASALFADEGELQMAADVFRNGFMPNPDPGIFYNFLVTGPGEFYSGDEILILKEGRDLWFSYNAMFTGPFPITDARWVPGYFASLIMDYGHALDYLEVGHIGDGRWDQLGDDFSAPSLTYLYNQGVTKTRVFEGEVQVDPTLTTNTGTFYAHNFSKDSIHADDQFIRAEVKNPASTAVNNTFMTYIWGRAGSTAPNDPLACVGFGVSVTGGVQIATMTTSALTVRKSESTSAMGAFPVPCEIELQCIGNRYIGLVNGTAVIEWVDTDKIVPINADRRRYGFTFTFGRSSATSFNQSLSITSLKALTHSEMPTHKTPKLHALSRTRVSVDGGLISVVGEGLDGVIMFTADARPSVIRDDLFRSDNINYFEVPARPPGIYDVTWVGEGGVSTLQQAIEYVAKVSAGNYYPTPTTLTQQTTSTTNPFWYLIPLNPTEPDFTDPTVNGRIVGLKKGHYRFRTRYTFTNYRSDIRHRIVWTGGESTPYVGPGSAGSVDNTMEFTVNEDGQVEVQFLRTSSISHTIDNRFQFDLSVVSEGRVPIYAVKSGTQLLAATNNVFQQVTSFMNAMIDYVATYDINADSEMIVPETGQYTIEWQVNFSTNNNSNTARVVNQDGTVIVSKTTPSTLGRQVVNLTKGDRLRLEVSLASSGTVNARTVGTNTVFRIIPVV